MGYALMHSPCAKCGQIASYNPHRVPSIRIDGRRQPICQPCITEANRLRLEQGLEPIPVATDAYTAIHESQL